MADTFTNFTPATLKFLLQLKKHNNRDWFQANKNRYEQDVREPCLAFIRSMQRPLRKISKHLVASDRRVGGSLMRVYRDTRFSNDKTPYKTNIGIQFRHEQGRDVHAPGCYLHIEPGQLFLGVGVWHPDSATLAAIRQAIDREPSQWKRCRDNRKFRAEFELAGESLKRPPKGYDADHPLINDLKRKDFIGLAQWPEAIIHEEDLCERVTESCAAAKPLLRFLCKAQQIPF